jgi:hypothetical protein
MSEVVQNRIWLNVTGTQGDQDMEDLLQTFYDIYARHMISLQHVAPTAIDKVGRIPIFILHTLRNNAGTPVPGPQGVSTSGSSAHGSLEAAYIANELVIAKVIKPM